ncbi:MAG: transposase [Acidobacteria bacterium]|nr:transposase [Acidobacteriota bacterium]MCL5288404.1 transposase [Acidobacteriota bacterium]
MNRPPFERKNIRLHEENYRGQNWFFVTLCCEERKAVFHAAERAEWVIERLREIASNCAFAVDAYCVMPEHIHLLVRGTTEISDLLDFMKRFKQVTAYEYKHSTGQRLWQKKFYDHILRPKENAESVAWYIWLNPVRKGMVTQHEEYPWSGSFTSDWQKRKKPTSEWVPPWRKPV